MNLNRFKEIWMTYIKLWNQFVIQTFLILIWFLILTPTALLRRSFQKLFSSKPKKSETFFKKSDKIDPDHFLRSF